jgi:hypothetical protein
MYWQPDSNLSREREARRHRFMTTTRDNVRAVTTGPVTAGGTVSLPVSADELIEPLLMTVNGDATATGGVWNFTPGLNLDTTTIEWHDGANIWQGTGMRGNTLRFAGNVRQENIATMELFGQNVATLGSLTASLAERVPQFFEGWQTKVYVDDFGTAPGTTQVLGTLLNWDVTFNNNLTRKYFAENTLQAGAVPIGELEVTATFTLEAHSPATVAEFANWDANTLRVVSLVFGLADDSTFVALDLPGAWSTVDLTGSEEGTRTYQFTYGYVYDATNGYGIRVRCKTARTTAY